MSRPACLCTALRQAAQLSTALYDRALAPSGLKVTMYRVLKNVDEMARPSISELSRRLGLDRSTLGRNVRVLERELLVRLEGSDDERERVIVLTPQGRSALKAAKPLWAKAQKQMHRRLGGNVDVLFSALDDLSQTHTE